MKKGNTIVEVEMVNARVINTLRTCIVTQCIMLCQSYIIIFPNLIEIPLIQDLISLNLLLLWHSLL